MSEVRKTEGYTLLFLEILIVILNGLAIAVIVRFKTKYNPDILIFTLAVADLLKAFVPLNMTLYAYLKGREMTEGSAPCMIFGWTAFTLNCGIMLVMTLMAIDRYVAMCKPFRYKEFLPRKRLIYTIVGVFVFSGLHSMLPLTGIGKMRSYSNGSFCHFDFDSTKPASMGYSIFVLALGFSMLAVVIFCYTRTTFSVKGLMRRQRRMSTSRRDIDGADKKRLQMNRMFARLMIVMMAAFLLSWLLFMIVVLQHVSGWFEIAPAAHFWSMRLAVVNSVLNPMIGAAMCKPYRRGYLFILSKCVRCCGLRYGAENPWARSRRMSSGSRNSYERDQDEPGTNTTVGSKIKNVHSFTSYQDSGIFPDDGGTFGSHQAGIVNATYEMDAGPAGVTSHVKTRPRLTPKRISFKDEVEAKKLGATSPCGTEVQEQVNSNTAETATSQQYSATSSFDIPRNPPITQLENSSQRSESESGLVNTSDESNPVFEPPAGIDSVILVSSEDKQRRKREPAGDHLSGFEMLAPSSLVRPPRNNNLPRQPLSVDNNLLVSKETLPRGFCTGEGELHSKGHENKSEESRVTSSKVCYHEESQQRSPVLTVQITHFAIDKNSDVKTTTVNSPVMTDKQWSKSSSIFSPFSPRSSSFIERSRKRSVPQHKPRSRSLATDVSVVEVISSTGIVNTPENTKSEKFDSLKEQYSSDLSTGALFDTRRFEYEEKLLLDSLANLSKSKSSESVLCHSLRSQCRDRDLPSYRRHTPVFEDGKLHGSGNCSYSESDLAFTLPETVFLTENCSPRRNQDSFIPTTQVVSSYQNGAEVAQNMPLSPNTIYKQLSKLNKKQLEREIFC